MRRIALGVGAMAAMAVLISVRLSFVEAQTYQNLGTATCYRDCHDHDDEKEWSEKKDGDGKGKQHLNALNQLEDPSAEKYAKALGLSDVYDVSASCVKCHSTLLKGLPKLGVTCESCHGAASGWFKPHKEKNGYANAVAAGMRDVVKKPGRWAEDCLTCHVIDDAALIKAGHSSGDDFDLAKKFRPVALHWNSKYEEAVVADAARPVRARILQRRGQSPAATTAAGATPSSTGTPSARTPTTSISSPASELPPAATTTVPGASKPVASETPTSAGSAAGSPGTSGPPPPASGAASKSAPTGSPKARPGGTGAPSVPLPRAPGTEPVTPPPAVVTPGLPAVAPLPAPNAPVMGGPGGQILPAVPDPIDLPRTPAGMVASVQGRLAALLQALLARGARTPVRVTPPERPTVYRGADAELLRLQEEVIALALEALGTAPVTPQQQGAVPPRAGEKKDKK